MNPSAIIYTTGRTDSRLGDLACRAGRGDNEDDEKIAAAFEDIYKEAD